MREGKRLDLNPWLLPQDAFETMRNCGLKRGVLEKRRGYALFGQILAISTTTLNPTLQTNPVTGIFNHLSGSTQNLLVADQNRINEFVSSRPANKSLTGVADLGGSPNRVRFESTGHSFTADEINTITGDTDWNGTYRVENVSDANHFDIEHAASDTVVDAGTTATQEAFSDLTRNKIQFKPTNADAAQDTQPSDGVTINGVTSGATATLSTSGVMIDYGLFGDGDAFGTFVFDNGTVTGTFQAGEQLNSTGVLDSGDIYGYAIAANSDEAFTGDNTNFFWTENWDHDGVSDLTYITNNQNPIQLYDGTHLRQFSIDIGTDAARAGDNDVNSALLVVVFKERVILFSTNESGSDFFQRARWSAIKAPFSWPTANFKDAPTSDVIKGLDFIGEELYVWFEGGSVWRFTWTGDSNDPFQWENVSRTEGTVAQMSVVTQDDRQFALGASRIQVSNGRRVGPADIKIPDFTLGWNQDSLPFSNGVVLNEERQIHFTYASASALSDDSDQPDDGNVYPDSSLVLNYEDLSWSTHGLPIHTFGFSSIESDLTWDDVSDAWEDIDFSWNAGQAKSGFPTTLFGNHLGKVFQMNFAGSDDGSAIEFNAVSGQWNPFVKQGNKADFGFIRFLCDVDALVSFDVKFFLNTDTTAWQTKTITCDAVAGSDSLVWKQIDVKAVANFHRIEITNNASNNRPRIHAIIPYFKNAGGRMV
ncbi:hypothetical protein LCGC14_0362130 [marine sediment metagenome]|uniref:Uncharacterized protein n=1 Tax=marine sediment metagenome TaxID=412755 RepID=A0A0F9T7P5_9ZZZZ